MASLPKVLGGVYVFAGAAWLLVGLGQLGTREWFRGGISVLGGVSILGGGINQLRIAKGGK